MRRESLLLLVIPAVLLLMIVAPGSTRSVLQEVDAREQREHALRGHARRCIRLAQGVDVALAGLVHDQRALRFGQFGERSR